MKEDICSKFPELLSYTLTKDEAIVVAKRYKKDSSVDFYSDYISGHTFIELYDVGSEIDVPSVEIRQIIPSETDGYYEIRNIGIDFRDIPKIIKELKRVYNTATESAIKEDVSYYKDKKNLGMDILNEIEK